MFTIVFKGSGFRMTDTYTSYAELLARLIRVDWTSWHIDDIEVWAV